MSPEDTYEHTKALGEQLAKMYRDGYQLDVRVVRFPFLYGPKQYVVWPFNIVLYHALVRRPVELKRGAFFTPDLLAPSRTLATPETLTLKVSSGYS